MKPRTILISYILFLATFLAVVLLIGWAVGCTKTDTACAERIPTGLGASLGLDTFDLLPYSDWWLHATDCMRLQSARTLGATKYGAVRPVGRTSPGLHRFLPDGPAVARWDHRFLLKPVVDPDVSLVAGSTTCPLPGKTSHCDWKRPFRTMLVMAHHALFRLSACGCLVAGQLSTNPRTTPCM